MRCFGVLFVTFALVLDLSVPGLAGFVFGLRFRGCYFQVLAVSRVFGGLR